MPAELPQPKRIKTPNPANYSSPSVPISVYKQLAGELNVVKTEVVALKSENQQLRSNNQKLQNQVHQVIQAAEHLKQMVNRYDFGAETYQVQAQSVPQPPQQMMPPTPQPQLPAAAPPAQYPSAQQFQAPQPVAAPPSQNGTAQYQASPTMTPATNAPKQVTTVAQPKLKSSEDVEGGINGWVIVLAAIAIILTAFGAGYMVVLPLLNNNNTPSQ
ncbi:hypothetical protein Lepto7376_3848 [[Leptolyngbya] sp. PCC 7376]|uniref:hypothetical protein n=1 Tax=[Leptolyngbya] sp. PCC 7376 TaxID=111781 RepID=UPI00029EF7FD|nr:hypothetical protein [[Leptolyngbya] sp. PCC 7376]AFY40005.1 hypothetical protein Lepto7376_3848 [[Leptolyngbya] sp. PCC 7376]